MERGGGGSGLGGSNMTERHEPFPSERARTVAMHLVLHEFPFELIAVVLVDANAVPHLFHWNGLL